MICAQLEHAGGLLCVLLLAGVPGLAQSLEEADPIYPANQPKCISFFLKNDYQLNPKQKTCDWIQNRVFSPTAAVGAAWSAGFSQVTENAEDRAKGTQGFFTRFSINLAQSSMKATGAFVTGFLSREDPRRAPPYLSRFDPERLPLKPARGFWNRTRRAVFSNFIAYRCVKACTRAEDIKAVPALGKIAGSFASGFSSLLWAPDRLNTPGHALRRTASAYGATFADSLFVEFKPEITAFGKSIARVLGVR